MVGTSDVKLYEVVALTTVVWFVSLFCLIPGGYTVARYNEIDSYSSPICQTTNLKLGSAGFFGYYWGDASVTYSFDNGNTTFEGTVSYPSEYVILKKKKESDVRRWYTSISTKPFGCKMDTKTNKGVSENIHEIGGYYVLVGVGAIIVAIGVGILVCGLYIIYKDCCVRNIKLCCYKVRSICPGRSDIRASAMV